MGLPHKQQVLGAMEHESLPAQLLVLYYVLSIQSHAVVKVRAGGRAELWLPPTPLEHRRTAGRLC